MLKRIVLSTIAILMVFAIAYSYCVDACFDPSNLYSIEVILNKPGIEYNLSILRNINNVIEVRENVYVYRGIVYRELAVIIYLQGFEDSKPVLDESKATKFYPVIRIEVVDKNLINELEKRYSNDLAKIREELTSMLRYELREELKWLRTIGVIKGITDDDIEKIVQKTYAGYAGWNRRLMYYNGDWYTFEYLVINGYIQSYLLRFAGCSIQIPTNTLPREPPTTTITTSSMGEYTTYSSIPSTSIPIYDNRLVTIAIGIGIATAIAIFIVFKHR